MKPQALPLSPDRVFDRAILVLGAVCGLFVPVLGWVLRWVIFGGL
jgi:hypothetical protein